MPRRPVMSPADSAWLGMRHRGGPMVVDAVLRIDGDLDADVVRDLFRERLLPRFPALSRRPAAVSGLLGKVTGLAGWDPGWVPDLHEVIGEVRLDGPLTRQVLETAASALVSVSLDPWVTPWRVDVVRGGDLRSSALVIRLHHSIGDGVALNTVLDALLDPVPDPLPGRDEKDSTSPRTGDRRPTNRGAHRGLRAAAAAVAVPPMFLAVVAAATRRRLPLRDTGVTTGVAWSRPHDLAGLKATAAARGVSLNDVLLAALAGGLRTYLLAQGQPADDARVIVPVDLRAPDGPVDGDLGNHIGVLFVRLPVSTADVAARVAAVHKHTRRLKRSLQPGSTALLLRAVGVVPRRLQEAAAALLGASADAVVSNVPGPTVERAIAGRRLHMLVFWVPRVGAMTLGVSVFSYAGTVTVGVATASACGAGGRREVALTAAVDAELDSMARLRGRDVAGRAALS